MTAASCERLEGLAPDSLLAFLALLGTLRALETAVPEARPRAYWQGQPVRPVLTLAGTWTRSQIAEAAARGCAILAADHDFGGDADLTFDRARARTLLEQTARPDRATQAALFGALFSDGAFKEDGRVWPAPLCAMFGQGGQRFLARMETVPKGILPNAMKKKKDAPDLNAPARIAEALFSPWNRQDETESFRWDPSEDRRYALRYRAPTKDKGRTVHGANRLAAIGLAALPGAAVERRGRMRFLTLGAEVDGAGPITISWPIWSYATSLTALRAMMAHPELVAAKPDLGRLEPLGIIAVRRSRRISVGKYFNFTRAEVV